MKKLIYATLLLVLAAPSLWAGNRELETVAAAVDVVQIMSANPLKCIPPAMLHDARGVAVISHVVKAGVLFDRRFGRGVLLVHQPDGSWSDPVFVTLEGGGVGLQAGIEATDLVLVFKTEASLSRILNGKGRLTLGADATIAAGPVGRELEAAPHLFRKADVYSYSHSRGLFAGLSLEGDRLRVDGAAIESFYHIKGGHPTEVLTRRGAPIAIEVQHLKEHLIRIDPPVAPPAVIIHR